MKVKIKKSTLRGTINAPSSKSMAHRLLICAALAEGVSTVHNVTPCEDVLATLDCLRALGASVDSDKNSYTVTGTNIFKSHKNSLLSARESGSTLRFMIPIASLSGEECTIVGAESLMRRPMGVYEEIFESRGLQFYKKDNAIKFSGALSPGEYVLRGDVSSQFITGLLFALPLLSGDSVIKILPPFESRSYVELTLIAMREFGVIAEFSDACTIKISGNQKYAAHTTTAEGDYSASAFLEAFNTIGSDINIGGLMENSAQGDKIYRELFPLLKSGAPKIDITNCPDLGPILFALASYFNGAEFSGTERLRIKESDRCAAMASELRKFGADIEIYENRVVIKKAALHAPEVAINAHNDHRVVMSCSVLLSIFGGIIEGAEAVSKSYPAFFTDIASLGAEVTIYD